MDHKSRRLSAASPVSRNARTVAAPPSAVWQVLSDGWLFPVWVVGAARMREVDDHWPEVGAKLYHSFGIWPMLINDNTEVLQALPDHLLRLRTRGWPAGEAEVVLRLEADGAGTRITLDEDAVQGPGSFVPRAVRTPLLEWRNTETLRRLGFVVENRQEAVA